MSDSLRKVITLFKPGEHDDLSGWFTFKKQMTIQGTGLGPNDKITFELLHIAGGEFEMWCNCDRTPPKLPDVEAYSTLMCPECGDMGEAITVSLTARNPVVVLNAPQGTPLRARFTGENVESISVWATLETDTQDVTAAMSGCPNICDMVWIPTGNVECDVDNDIFKQEMVDVYGNLKWDESPLTWTATGNRRPNADDPDNKVDVEEADNCGDLRWTEGVVVEWEATGEIRCANLDETSPTYTVEEEQVNQFDEYRWVEKETLYWQNTGIDYKCVGNKKYIEQETRCGDVRWFNTEEPCKYYATYQLDSGGWAYRPGQQDPEATVALEDCDGTIIAYIYPEPKDGATVPVTEGCDECPTGEMVLGYAVNSDGMTIQLPKGADVQTIQGSLESLPALVINKMPKLEISNFPTPEVFDGIIRHLPDLEISNLDTIKVKVEKLPPFATNTFVHNGQLYKLYSDGTYEKMVIAEGEQLVRLYYLLNGMPSAGNVPQDLTQYELGSVAILKPWPRELPDGLRLKGYSLTADGAELLEVGARLNMNNEVRVYAIWNVGIIYTAGTDDIVLDMPNDTWHDVNDQVRISHQIPNREGYRFAGWITSRGDNRLPGDTLRITAPIVLRAKWVK